MQVSQSNPFAADRMLSLRRSATSQGTIDPSLTPPEHQGGRQARGERDRQDTSPPAPVTLRRFEPVGGYAAATTRTFSSSLVALDLSALPSETAKTPVNSGTPSAREAAAYDLDVNDLLARALGDT